MPRNLGTIGAIGLGKERWDSFLCGFFFIGHWWKDATPARLVDSGHRRVECRRCKIQRYRFRTSTQAEMDEIMNIAAGGNRESRRALQKKSTADSNA